MSCLWRAGGAVRKSSSISHFQLVNPVAFQFVRCEICETLTTAPWTDCGSAARATGHATAASAMAILAYVLAVLLVVPSVADVSNAQRTESIKVGSEDVDGAIARRSASRAPAAKAAAKAAAATVS